MRLWLILFATFLLGSMATPIALAHGEKPPVDFLKQIRPLFEKHCHQCHGADTQEAGLRLDLRADALAGSDSGPVIVAGRSDESLLIKLVSDDDRDRLMPPEGDRLSRAQVLQLRTWIDAGAEWPDSVAGDESSRRSNHWAFQPIRAAEAPLIANRRWSRNYVDAYISHKLEQNGTNPSSEAQPETLVRRAFLDLVGTLPSPDEVDRLVNDQIPDAYEKMIDRLLASPRFGERWGRHWLDLARYADSDGYEKDEVRPFAWRWRDWVISAFNSDMPFDQFTIEQLAGDLLPNATLEQKVATGLHRNTLISTEGGSDQEEFRVKATVDRVNTTGAAWMGLTIGCAQCHSHKYDPISQREYYQMFAFFNSLDRVDIPAPTAVESLRFAVRKQRFDRDHAPFLRAVADYEKSNGKRPGRNDS